MTTLVFPSIGACRRPESRSKSWLFSAQTASKPLQERACRRQNPDIKRRPYKAWNFLFLRGGKGDTNTLHNIKMKVLTSNTANIKMGASRNSKPWNMGEVNRLQSLPLSSPVVGVSSRLMCQDLTLSLWVSWGPGRPLINSCLCHRSLTVPETLAWLAFPLIRRDDG